MEHLARIQSQGQSPHARPGAGTAGRDGVESEVAQRPDLMTTRPASAHEFDCKNYRPEAVTPRPRPAAELCAQCSLQSWASLPDRAHPMLAGVRLWPASERVTTSLAGCEGRAAVLGCTGPWRVVSAHGHRPSRYGQLAPFDAGDQFTTLTGSDRPFLIARRVRLKDSLPNLAPSRLTFGLALELFTRSAILPPQSRDTQFGMHDTHLHWTWLPPASSPSSPAP